MTGTTTSATREPGGFVLRATTPLAADAEQVWAVLTALDDYAAWNPFLVRATGSLEVGERIEVRMQPQGGWATTFRPRVTEVDPGRRFAWLGHLGVPGLFDGAHSFTLRPISAGACELVQEEHFRGVLVPLLRGWLRRRTLPAFVAMNEALGARAAGTR